LALQLITRNAATAKHREATLDGRKHVVVPMTMIVPGVAGVYRIRNLVNGKVYIGSTASDLAYRWREHRKRLRGGQHGNRHLQSAWNKYGEHNFIFEVIENCLRDDCVSREQSHMDACRAVGGVLYNLAPNAGTCRGVKHTEEVRQANRERNRNRQLSDEALQSIRLAAFNQRGCKRSPQARARMKLAQNRPEVIAKVKSGLASSEKNKQRHLNHRGFRHTDEAKLKMSLSKKGVPKSEEFKRKLSAKRMGHSVSQETRDKISATLKARV
jgi:group I intron endonuclease